MSAPMPTCISFPLIKESILEILKAKEKIDNEIPQILTNWCLVRFCSLTKRMQTKEHWFGELRGHLITASRFSIKENDSFEKREKVLNEIFNENDYYKPHFLNLTICNKFIKENINIKSEEYVQTILDCINNFKCIFNIILSRDVDLIKQYVMPL